MMRNLVAGHGMYFCWVRDRDPWSPVKHFLPTTKPQVPDKSLRLFASSRRLSRQLSFTRSYEERSSRLDSGLIGPLTKGHSCPF